MAKRMDATMAVSLRKEALEKITRAANDQEISISAYVRNALRPILANIQEPPVN